MFKLEVPFHLSQLEDKRFCWGGVGDRRAREAEVALVALSIRIETNGRAYEICSDEDPLSDSPSFRGTMWPRSLLRLTRGISIEQQMLLPAGGDTVAISWRLIGRTIFPARLKVSPIFHTRDPISAASFAIEPETNGGRLAWQPYEHSSKIIADTNGRRAGWIDSPLQGGLTPATFEFDLGSHPAVLIFSTELQSTAGSDPLIGGFLAQLAQQPTAMTEYDHRRDLVAA